MSDVMQEVLDLLDLETIEKGIFRGPSRNFFGKNVFGGQVLGQALMAAGRTVEGRLPHSLHGYFLRAGDVKAPIVYQVETIRDGKSFCTRNVKGIQHGENIFLMSASFAVPEEGLDHQSSMPEVQGPDDLPSEHQLRALIAPMIPEKIRSVFERERPVEIRPIDPVNPFAPVKKEAVRRQWMKSQSRLPDDPLLHMCILAFASDFGLMSTAMLPHYTALKRSVITGPRIPSPTDVFAYVCWLASCMPPPGPCASGSFSAWHTGRRRGRALRPRRSASARCSESIWRS